MGRRDREARVAFAGGLWRGAGGGRKAADGANLGAWLGREETKGSRAAGGKCCHAAMSCLEPSAMRDQCKKATLWGWGVGGGREAESPWASSSPWDPGPPFSRVPPPPQALSSEKMGPGAAPLRSSSWGQPSKAAVFRHKDKWPGKRTGQHRSRVSCAFSRSRG